MNRWVCPCAGTSIAPSRLTAMAPRVQKALLDQAREHVATTKRILHEAPCCDRKTTGSPSFDRSLIRVAPLSEPSPRPLAVDPIPSFGFALKSGDLLGMAARPNCPYVPFAADSEGLGIDFDLVVRFGHARQCGAHRGAPAGFTEWRPQPNRGLPPGVQPSGRGILCSAPWPKNGRSAATCAERASTGRASAGIIIEG